MKIMSNPVLLTEGRSEIRFGLSRRFHEEGNTVIVAGRREASLRQFTAEHDDVEGVVLDGWDPQSIARCFPDVTTRHLGLNDVVKNAGVMIFEDLTDPGRLPVTETVLATKCAGPARLMQATLSGLG